MMRMMMNYDLYLRELELFSQKIEGLMGGDEGSEREVRSIF